MMIIRNLAIAGLLVAAAVPAAAAVPLPDTPTTFTNIGDVAGFGFNGIANGAIVDGLTSLISFRLFDVSADRKTWTFSLDTIANTSSAPVTASRLSGYGFNLESGVLDSAVGRGLFPDVGSGNFAQIGGTIDLCFKNANSNNCAGFGNGGLLIGQSVGGDAHGFTLVFENTLESLTLNQFVVRYQSIDAPGIIGGSGIGRIDLGGGGDPLPVPEPATWAMLVMGFGLVGAMRRRRTVVAA